MNLRKIIMLIVVLTSGFTGLFAQKTETKFQCGYDEIQQQMWQENPSLQVEYENFLKNFESFEKEIVNKRGTKKYIIPVVFHVLHQNGIENISDAQIADQIAILNRDYNSIDTTNIQPEFKNLIANCNFEFRLAQKDPMGNCTNGIEHIYSNFTNNAGPQSKINQWNRNQYLNVWVVKQIGVDNKIKVLGNALQPMSAQSNYKLDGVLICYDCVGSILQSNVQNSSTLTHEVGHFLGLPHVWGNNNNVGENCGDDGVADTPLTKGSISSCNKSSNSNPNACVEPETINYSFNGVTKTSGQTDTTKLNVFPIKNLFGLDPVEFPIKAQNLSSNSTQEKQFSFSKWPTGGKNNDTLMVSNTGKINLSKYYEIKIAPKKGTLIDINKLTFKIGRNKQGVKNIAVKSSLDTFKVNLPINLLTKQNPTLTFNFSYDTVKCAKVNKVSPKLSQNFPSGGNFKGESNLFIDSISGDVDLVKTKTGSYKITYTLPKTNLTNGISITKNIVIIPVENPKLSYSNSDFCQSGTTKPTSIVKSGGVFTSSIGLKINPTTGVIDLEKSIADHYTIKYEVNDTNKCLASSKISINISPIKVNKSKFNYSSFCKNQDSILPIKDSLFTKGGIFTTNINTLILDSITGKVNPKLSSNGTYLVFYNLRATSCNPKPSVDTASLTIINDTINTIKYSSNYYCNDTLHSVPMITGNKLGVFASDDSLAIDIKTGEINFNKSKKGIHEIRYKSIGFNKCQSETVTKINYTNGILNDTISKIKYSSFYYCNDTLHTVPMITGNKLGVFASDDSLAIDSKTGEINFNKSKKGIHEIFYQTSGLNSCKLSVKTTINYTNNYINDSLNSINYGSYIFSDTITPTKPIITGVKNGVFYADKNLTIDSVTGTLNLNKSKFGIHTIYYNTISKERCKLQAVTKINFIDSAVYSPEIKFSYPTNSCANKSSLNPILAENFVQGGEFKANNNLIINSKTGEIDLTKSKIDSTKYKIIYSLKTKYKTYTDSISINIYNPNVKMTYPTIVNNQVGEIKPLRIGDLSGKFYTNIGMEIDSLSGKINLANSKTGKYTVSYNLKNICHDTMIKFPIQIITPTIRNSSLNEFVYVSDTNAMNDVSITLGKKFNDLKGLDTLKFRIYGWNSENDSVGTLDLDSVSFETKFSPIENIENYMDYTSCKNRMFTLGQANLMRFFLESTISSRNNLWTESNLKTTGVFDTTNKSCSLPIADFYLNVKKNKDYKEMNVCSGDPLIFNDISYNGTVTSRKWIFENGTPATDTTKNPEVVFTAAGGHNITLIVSNKYGSDTLRKYIFVTGLSSVSGELIENFNSGFSWDWRVEDYNVNSSRFDLSATNGKSNSKCLKLDNYRDITKYYTFEEGYQHYTRLEGTIHSIMTPAINLSTTKNVTLSFDYAFATDSYSDSITDKLNVYRSTNCGQKWDLIHTIGGPKYPVVTTGNTTSTNTLLTAGNSSGTPFLPQSDNLWKNSSIKLPVGDVDTRTRIKFEFIPSKKANNFYIDNLAITGTLEIEESPLTKMNINVYPNPTSSSEGISIGYLANNDNVTFELIDVQGKTLTKVVNTSKNILVKHTFDTNNLEIGCYFVKATQGAFTSTYKVVVF